MATIGFVGDIHGNEKSLVTYSPVVLLAGKKIVYEMGYETIVNPDEESYINFFDSFYDDELSSEEVLVFAGPLFLEAVELLSSIDGYFEKFCADFKNWREHQGQRWQVNTWGGFVDLNQCLIEALEKVIDSEINNNHKEGIILDAFSLYGTCYAMDRSAQLRYEIKVYEHLGDKYGADITRYLLKLNK